MTDNKYLSYTNANYIRLEHLSTDFVLESLTLYLKEKNIFFLYKLNIIEQILIETISLSISLFYLLFIIYKIGTQEHNKVN